MKAGMPRAKKPTETSLDELSAEERMLLAKALRVKQEAAKLARMSQRDRMWYLLEKEQQRGEELEPPANLAEIIEAGRKQAVATESVAAQGAPDRARCRS